MITEEDMRAMTIGSSTGAFREFLMKHQVDLMEPVVGIGVLFNTDGVITGTSLLLCGSLPEVELNTSDLYPEAPEHGCVAIKRSVLDNWVIPDGRLTSLWEWRGKKHRREDTFNWSTLMSRGGCYETISFAKHLDYHFDDLMSRLNIQPTSVDSMKISMGIVPFGVAVGWKARLKGYITRAFPTVAIINVQARIFPKEREGQNLGLGFMPIMVLSGGDGEVCLNTIKYPTSMDVKIAAVSLLRSSTKPNEEVNAAKWQKKVDDKDYTLSRSAMLWPEPRQEEIEYTYDSAASFETDGENF